jgi:hypothetical protein
MSATDAARPLTEGERALVRGMFHGSVDCDPVRLVRRRFWPFQPKDVLMTPMGHIHFHPDGPYWCDDFAAAHPDLQALFLHEMTHVWQSQRWGRWYLPLMRHPWCRYPYAIVPGRKFVRYGLEQQGDIVRHVHLLRCDRRFPGMPPRDQLESILPF